MLCCPERCASAPLNVIADSRNAVQDAKTRNEKEQGAIEAGEKLARELGLNTNLNASEANEVASDSVKASSPEALAGKSVLGLHGKSISISESSLTPSPLRDVSTASINGSPSKEIGSHAVLDLAADASSTAAT